MIPVLKGLQFTIDSWQPNRDEGMKPVGVRQVDISSPRLTARWSRRWLLMCLDLRALGELTDSAVVPHIQVCPTTMAAAGFIFGEASGMGFGRIFGALGWEGIWQLLQMALSSIIKSLQWRT
jgi:hypothetical protein